MISGCLFENYFPQVSGNDFSETTFPIPNFDFRKPFVPPFILFMENVFCVTENMFRNPFHVPLNQFRISSENWFSKTTSTKFAPITWNQCRKRKHTYLRSPTSSLAGKVCTTPPTTTQPQHHSSFSIFYEGQQWYFEKVMSCRKQLPFESDKVKENVTFEEIDVVNILEGQWTCYGLAIIDTPL